MKIDLVSHFYTYVGWTPEQGQALPEPAVAMDVAKRLKIPLEDVYASARVA